MLAICTDVHKWIFDKMVERREREDLEPVLHSHPE